jgi:hypothetical protein
MLTETFSDARHALGGGDQRLAQAGDLAFGRVAQLDVEGDVAAARPAGSSAPWC